MKKRLNVTIPGKHPVTLAACGWMLVPAIIRLMAMEAREAT